MAARRRKDKRRAGLDSDAIAWLAGEPCGFFEFKSHDELIPLWGKYGDPDVATWDMGRDTKPVAVTDQKNPCSGLIRAGAVQRA